MKQNKHEHKSKDVVLSKYGNNVKTVGHKGKYYDRNNTKYKREVKSNEPL